MPKSREVKQLIAALRKQGAVVEMARCGHWKVTNPKTGRTIQISASPRNERAILNSVTRLRKIGLLPRTSRSATPEPFRVR